jgi:hypothetical protein
MLGQAAWKAPDEHGAQVVVMSPGPATAESKSSKGSCSIQTSAALCIRAHGLRQAALDGNAVHGRGLADGRQAPARGFSVASEPDLRRFAGRSFDHPPVLCPIDFLARGQRRRIRSHSTIHGFANDVGMS